MSEATTDAWLDDHAALGCTIVKDADQGTIRVSHSEACQARNRELHAARLAEIQADRERVDRWLWWRAFAAELFRRPTRREVVLWFAAMVAGGLVGWLAT